MPPPRVVTSRAPVLSVESRHRTVDRERQGPSIHTEKAVLAVLRRLESHLESQAVDVKLLGDGNVVAGENGNGPFHGSHRFAGRASPTVTESPTATPRRARNPPFTSSAY